MCVTRTKITIDYTNVNKTKDVTKFPVTYSINKLLQIYQLLTNGHSSISNLRNYGCAS